MARRKQRVPTMKHLICTFCDFTFAINKTAAIQQIHCPKCRDWMDIKEYKRVQYRRWTDEEKELIRSSNGDTFRLKELALSLNTTLNAVRKQYYTLYSKKGEDSK